MPATTPPAITTPPLAPDPNDRPTFNSRAYPFTVWMRNVAAEIAAVALNCYNNALEAFGYANAASNSATNSSDSASAAAASATAANASKTAAEAAATAAGASAGLPALVNGSFLQVSSGGVLSWLAKSAETFWLAATNGLAKALAYTYLDKGTIAAAGTVNVLFSDGETQRVQAAGNLTLTVGGWAATGRRCELEIQCVNFGGKTITWPSLRWIIAGGGFTTVAGSNGVTFQTSGTDYLLLWTDDGGTTIYAKVLR